MVDLRGREPARRNAEENSLATWRNDIWRNEVNVSEDANALVLCKKPRTVREEY